VIVGGIAGAMKGQTTETGFCRGAGIGVISGTIVALELLDSLINGRFLSKVITLIDITIINFFLYVLFNY